MPRAVYSGLFLLNRLHCAIIKDMNEEIIYSDYKDLKNKEEALARGGKESLHVLADFDRTLTKAFVNGEYIPSLIWVLYNGDYLKGDYNAKSQALQDKYHAIETDPRVPKEEKFKAMEEWWQKQFDLLIDSKLNKKHIEAVTGSGRIKLREGADLFLKLLKEKDIPLVIMSSSGLGGDAISMFFQKNNLLFSNIYIVSNSFEWDKEGNALSVKEPIIHGMKKYETAVKDYPFFGKIEQRENVLLLGDSLDDVGMIEGFDFENLIKIGFLNKKVEEQKEDYKERYDVVVLNDGSMDYLNNLINKIE